MLDRAPTILALDFDGVVCDGLIEYFQTAWQAYCRLWSPSDPLPPQGLAEDFYCLRPVVEVGWEMPVLLRALIMGVPEAKIWQDWQAIAGQILLENNWTAAAVGAQVDGVRDAWIAADLEGWLAKHRFYPGIVEKMRSLLNSDVQLRIITTKEGRFVRQLLQQQGVNLPSECIIGKECQRPKHETLRQLLTLPSDRPASIWFVEDRLKTLQSVAQHSDLDAVRLYLADWGYNTATARDSIRQDPRISLISLSQFADDFSVWP